MGQYWDSKGRLHIEGEKPLPLAERLARKAQAIGTNLYNWINESNPNSESYKQKTNAILALETLPIGAGAKATQAITQSLKPYVGRQIAKTTAQGIGAGATGGGVEGFGRGLIEGQNPFLTGGEGLLYGALGGGLLGLGAGKVGQFIDFKKLYKNGTPETFNKYFDDYIEGLNNYSKPMADYRNALANTKVPDIKRYGKGKYNNLFVGRRAENLNKLGDFDRAQALDWYEDAKNPEIWKETGWFKGVDGNWRYEIPEGKLIDGINWEQHEDYKGVPFKSTKLSEIYDNPTFYDAYPNARDIDVNVYDMGNSGGSYNPMSDEINLDYARNYRKTNPETIKKLEEIKQDPLYIKAHTFNKEPSQMKKDYFEYKNSELGKYENELLKNLSMDGWNDDALKTLQHELQHYIQEVEHFAKGGSPESVGGYKDYFNLAGEAEARLAERRTGLADELLKKYEPYKKSKYGYDIAPTKQTLNTHNGRYGTGKVYSLSKKDQELVKNLQNKAKQLKTPKPIEPTLKNEGEIVIMKGSEPFEEGEIDKIITDTTFPMSDDEITKGVAVRYQGDHSFIMYYDKDGKHTMGKFKITEEKYD